MSFDKVVVEIPGTRYHIYHNIIRFIRFFDFFSFVFNFSIFSGVLEFCGHIFFVKPLFSVCVWYFVISQVVSSAEWKVEHRVLSLVKLGFKREEAEAALSSSPSGEVMGHDTLIRLLEPLRPPPAARPSSSSAAVASSGGGEGSAEHSSSIRQEEVHTFSYRVVS